MSDRIFFPAILALVLGLVLIALQPAARALPSGSVSGGGGDYARITVDGPDLNRIIAGGESDIELLGEGTARILRIETKAGALSPDPARGPHFRLAADIENVFQGRTLEITIRARASDKYGAQAFTANYSAGKAGESGWTDFDLAQDWRDYVFRYEVPELNGQQGVDYLAIRPVTPEKRRAVEIERVIFKPLAPWAEPPQG